jgi:4,5-DOPA dioxygenase extradiol
VVDLLYRLSPPVRSASTVYIIGTRTESEPVTFPVEGVDGGSISMLAVRLG